MSQIVIELQLGAQSYFQNKNFVNSSKKLLKKEILHSSRRALFHMKTGVFFNYFVHDCRLRLIFKRFILAPLVPFSMAILKKYTYFLVQIFAGQCISLILPNIFKSIYSAESENNTHQTSSHPFLVNSQHGKFQVSETSLQKSFMKLFYFSVEVINTKFEWVIDLLSQIFLKTNPQVKDPFWQLKAL